MEDCRPLSSSQSSKKGQKVGLDSPYRLLYCSNKGDKAGVMHELEKGLDSQLPCYEIEHTEVNMDEATLIGEDEAGRLKVTDFGLSKIAQQNDMFLGGPPNLAEDPEKIADKRAYEDSRPPLFSYLYPEPIRT
ncbi:hypothetical protein GBA52_022767 [Prunus armeniaca]|nr:hypothetical protein GBA52_022767 [Prunus armeniaca]